MRLSHVQQGKLQYTRLYNHENPLKMHDFRCVGRLCDLGNVGIGNGLILTSPSESHQYACQVFTNDGIFRRIPQIKN